MKFKKGQKVHVYSTKKDPAFRAGVCVGTQSTTKGDFIEVQLDGVNGTNKFRPAKIIAA